MDSVYDYVTLVSFVLSALFLCLSVGLFFGLHIPNVLKEINGSLVGNMNNAALQKQMAKIRQQNRQFNQKKGKLDIFGDLENWLDDMPSDGDMPTSAFGMLRRKATAAKTAMLRSGGAGTMPLRKSENRLVIEKDVDFVATDRCL